MRKTVTVLILLLPLLFIFIVFSTASVGSLGVDVKPTEIRILNKPENDTLFIDLADPKPYTLVAEVYPVTAANKEYTFVVEPNGAEQFADVRVDKNGNVTAHSVGQARITATPIAADVDKKDSITVVVGSSAPYDVLFSLCGMDGSDLLTPTADGYSAKVDSGSYNWQYTLVPGDFTTANVALVGDGNYAVLSSTAETLLLPFSGRTVLSVTVPNAAGGELTKQVVLDVAKAHTASGITVNGVSNAQILLENGTMRTSFFVECDGEPTFSAANAAAVATSLGANRYRMDVTFTNAETSVVGTVACGGKTESVRFTFGDFEYTIRASRGLTMEDGSYHATLLRGVAVNFYAVAASVSDGVTWQWSASDPSVNLQASADGSSVSVTADSLGKEFTLKVQAYRGGEKLLDEREITLEVIRQVAAVNVLNKLNVGLSGIYVVAGEKAEGTTASANDFLLRIMAYDNRGAIDGVDDLAVTLSDDSLVTYDYAENGIILRALGTGRVEISIQWKGNAIYGNGAGLSFSIDVAVDAVEVDTSPELYHFAGLGRKVALSRDIMLGTDEAGNVLPTEQRRALIGTMRSTYNTAYYENIGQSDSAAVSYAMEFKSDVYGNGFSVNAEYISNSYDGTGKTPLFFRGPLYFVDYGEHLASVAGQDNIAFLVRTDGVTLYNVTLLGCSDSSLETDGGADLTKLEKVGTTLDINADCRLLNCRIRNGRNTVRVYGGNRNGDNYFVTSLTHEPIAEADRAVVEINGCVISQSREFLLKVGANRALRATMFNGDMPYLTDQNGITLEHDADLSGQWFYDTYVMTDVTLTDSVLETSGLFTIGVESNFGGSYLNRDSSSTSKTQFKGWAGTGGTSFASVLRITGDTRMYDWKNLNLVDSSTLISTSAGGGQFAIKIGDAFKALVEKDPATYGGLLQYVDLPDGKGQTTATPFVHGGIALYGGGRNYARLQLSLNESNLDGLKKFVVNIDILAEVADPDNNFGYLAEKLPLAAGLKDFRFWLYSADSSNNYTAQQQAESASPTSPGYKYGGIPKLTPFAH